MISGGHKSKLIHLNFGNDFLGCEKLKIVNIKVNPSCNMHLILKFYVGLKHMRAVSSAVLQKMG